MTISAKRIARSVSATASCSSCSSIRARRRKPAVSTSRIARPRHCHSTAIASRVIPGSGPVSSRSSPTRRLTRVDLPTFGRPTIASCSGRSLLRLRRASPLLPQRRDIAQPLVELGKPLAVLRRDRHRSPRPAHRPRRQRRSRPCPRPCWRRARPACRSCAASRRNGGRRRSRPRGRR